MNKNEGRTELGKQILIKYKEDIFPVSLDYNISIEQLIKQAAEHVKKFYGSLYFSLDGNYVDEDYTLGDLRIRRGETFVLHDKLLLKVKFENSEKIYDVFLFANQQLRELEIEFLKLKDNNDSLDFYKGEQLLDDKINIGELKLTNGELILVKTVNRFYKYQFRGVFYEENLEGKQSINVSQFLQIVAQKINKDPNNLVLLCYDVQQDENQKMNQIASKVDLEIDEYFNLTIIFDTLNQQYNLKVFKHEQMALDIQYDIIFVLDSITLVENKTLEQNKVKPGSILKAQINYPGGYIYYRF